VPAGLRAFSQQIDAFLPITEHQWNAHAMNDFDSPMPPEKT
jgi:hypothetical protein